LIEMNIKSIKLKNISHLGFFVSNVVFI
jgi:hypothetical protein